jgi:hypothetical protein
MSFTDDILNDDISASQIALNTVQGDYGTSDWQRGLLSLGTSYVTGLAQIDLAKRRANAGTATQIVSNQSPVGADLTTRAASGLGTLRLGDVLPFAVLGLGAWLIFGKG